jgi:hypothetical protein
VALGPCKRGEFRSLSVVDLCVSIISLVLVGFESYTRNGGESLKMQKVYPSCYQKTTIGIVSILRDKVEDVSSS